MTPAPARLGPFVEPLKVGEAMGHLNLTLVPLRGDGHGQLDYILAADAIASGQVRVTEVSESGTVPQLTVVNDSDRTVLFLDGEELVGARQNRILNTSILVAAKTKVNIPVSCVEQGRWRYVSPDFKAGPCAPSALRARKSHDVTRSLKAEGVAASDQGAVWQEVAASHAALGCFSPTMALHDAVSQRRESLNGYVTALQYPQGARGVWASVNGGFAAMDLFDRPETLERVWPRLVTGYALDALAWLNTRRLRPSASGPLPVLDRLCRMECQPCPSVGVGEDWRFESDDIVGQALVAEGVCVHLSAFPGANGEGRYGWGAEREIAPPSRRRRGRRSPPRPDVPETGE